MNPRRDLRDADVRSPPAQMGSALATGAAAALAVTWVAGPDLLAFRDGDLPVHIRYGQTFLDERRIPLLDRTVSPPAPLVDHEWAYDILSSIMYHHTGISGIVTFTVLGYALCAALAMRVIHKQCSSFTLNMISLSCLMLTGWSHLATRPHIISWLAVLLLLPWLETWTTNTTFRKQGVRALLVFLSTAVWVNLHGGAILFPLLIAAVAFRTAISTKRISQTVTAYALPVGASAVGLLVNPWGPELLVHISEFLSSDIVKITDDFQPPDPISTFAGASMLLLTAWTLFMLAAGAGDRSQVVWTLAILVWGWTAARNVALAGWLLAPTLGILGQRVERAMADSGSALIGAIDAFARRLHYVPPAALAVTTAVLVVDRIRYPTELSMGPVPVEAIRALPSFDEGSLLASTFASGWVALLRPDVPLFFHSLTANFGDASTRLPTYLKVANAHPGWQHTARSASIRGILTQDATRFQGAAALPLPDGLMLILVPLDGEDRASQAPVPTGQLTPVPFSPQ